MYLKHFKSEVFKNFKVTEPIHLKTKSLNSSSRAKVVVMVNWLTLNEGRWDLLLVSHRPPSNSLILIVGVSGTQFGKCPFSYSVCYMSSAFVLYQPLDFNKWHTFASFYKILELFQVFQWNYEVLEIVQKKKKNPWGGGGRRGYESYIWKMRI